MTDTLWVAIGFLIFIGIVVWAGGFKALMSGIDSRGEKIAAELSEAKRLRDEAQALLASYEQKKAEAEKDAATIIEAAKLEAERFKAEAAQKLEDFVARRQKQAELKISQAESQAAAEVRAAAAELAAQAAGQVLAAQSGTETAFKAALGEIKAKLN
ncbi:MAG TPA: ATP F0F1 synthase subunit B [Beijerinckiaceae bacterium]|nr:ATP F0F1 synthase subunit B [Beijerinckiaceae bacterium]